MKKLITICLVVLMLSATCVSWASVIPPGPNVTPPPGPPRWWNVACDYYAYGWWEADIYPGSGPVSPPPDPTHWA
jgi:hypothetical protein